MNGLLSREYFLHALAPPHKLHISAEEMLKGPCISMNNHTTHKHQKPNFIHRGGLQAYPGAEAAFDRGKRVFSIGAAG